MGIVIFSSLSEGSSYVFTTADLGETYVEREGTNISIGLYPTLEELVGVKSYLELEEINNMVSSNPVLYNEILDPVAYTSKFTLLTHKNELIETHVADVQFTNVAKTQYRPLSWNEWKSPHRKFSKKIGNTVPDLINAHHTNTPEGKTVILSKYDDSVHVLDSLGESLYRYKLESGSALSVIALAANDDFIFLLRWKETLSESTIADDPKGTGFFNDFYEIDQRFLSDGNTVTFEWISSGLKTKVDINTSVFIPINCSLENSESFLNLDIELGSSLSNNFVFLQNNMDCLNCVLLGTNLEGINNAILCGDSLVIFSDNFVSLGINLQNEAVREYVKLSAVLKCYQFVAGYFEVDHSTEVIFRKSIHISEGIGTKTRSITSNYWANELDVFDLTYEDGITKIRPNIQTLTAPQDHVHILEKDYTSVYNIRMSANKEGLFIIGSDNYLDTGSWSGGKWIPDSLPKYEASDPDALRLRSFFCQYDIVKKWPTNIAAQVNRVCWLGFFVNDTTLGMCFPSRTTIGVDRNYIKMIWYKWKNNISFERESTVSSTPNGAKTRQTQWHQNIGQRDGFAKQCFLNSLVIGFLPYSSSDYSSFPIDKPKSFLSSKFGSTFFGDTKYSKFTPSFLSFHLKFFPNYVKTSIELIGQEIKGLKLNCNQVGIDFSINNGVKVSGEFFQDHCIKLNIPLLQDSHGGLKISARLANKGYREKTVMVSNSSLIADEFLPSREYFNYIQSVSPKEREYHYEQLNRYRGDYYFSNIYGQYPQNLHYWTKNEYIPSEIVFGLFPNELPEEFVDSGSLYLSIEFFAKEIESIQDSVLLDFGLYSDKIGENLSIGYIKDNEWFIRTSDGLTEQYISLGNLPTNSWDFYIIFIHNLNLNPYSTIKIYKNGSLLNTISDCLIRFGNEKIYIGQNSRKSKKLCGFVDQFKLKRYESANISWNINTIPNSLIDPTDPAFDYSTNGIFCLNGQNGISDESGTYKIKNNSVKVSKTEYYYGSTSVHFDSNSFLEVQPKETKGVGWRVSSDIVNYKKHHKINTNEGFDYSDVFKRNNEYEFKVIPPIPIHFEVDSNEGFLFGIFNKFDDDFSYTYYHERIGGYFPFSIGGETFDNENILIKPDLISDSYWNNFYDAEGTKLAITKQFDSGANYLPSARIFRTSNPNTKYDIEVNLPVRIIEENTLNTYWFNYRKLGIDKTNKRLIVIRIKGGLDYRGYNNQYENDLTEEGRRTSSYELYVPEGDYPFWSPRSDLTVYTDIKFDYLMSENVYVVNTYTQRDFLIYNYELGFVDHISVINGLQDDDVVCHLYEKNGIYYILTQVKEPEPASPEDFFNTVLQNQTGYESDTHFYKYTRYVYKKTRVYTLKGNLKTDIAVLLYEFNYSSSSLDSIMIQEVTDRHIWLNWDGVNRFEPIPFIGFALNIDGSGYTEVPFLQTVYFNNETQKWEIIVREITDDNRLPPGSLYPYEGASSRWDRFPIKIIDRFPKTGNPIINPISDKYAIRDIFDFISGNNVTSEVSENNVDITRSFYFAIVTDKVLSYDEQNFDFLREENVFQETVEIDLEDVYSIWYWSKLNTSTDGTAYSYGDERKFAMYPAVSRVLTIKLYDWVKTNVFLVKTMSPVSQPNTWITYTNGGLFNFPFTVTDFIKSSPLLDDNRTVKTDVILG